jgi:hypothetical protein
MRAREFIPEVVDIGQAPDTQWSRRPDLDTYRGRGVEVGQWKDTTGADVSSQFRKDFKGEPGKTDVKFSRTDASGSPTMGISGTAGGKSSKILGGVVNNIKTFLDKNPDQTTLAFRSQEPSRTSLYSKMVDRIAPQLGMVGSRTDLGKGTAEFSLSRAKPGEAHAAISSGKIRGGGSGGVGAANTRDMQMGADLDPKALIMRNQR